MSQSTSYTSRKLENFKGSIQRGIKKIRKIASSLSLRDDKSTATDRQSDPRVSYPRLMIYVLVRLNHAQVSNDEYPTRGTFTELPTATLRFSGFGWQYCIGHDGNIIGSTSTPRLPHLRVAGFGSAILDEGEITARAIETGPTVSTIRSGGLNQPTASHPSHTVREQGREVIEASESRNRM